MEPAAAFGSHILAIPPRGTVTRKFLFPPGAVKSTAVKGAAGTAVPVTGTTVPGLVVSAPPKLLNVTVVDPKGVTAMETAFEPSLNVLESMPDAGVIEYQSFALRALGHKRRTHAESATLITQNGSDLLVLKKLFCQID